MPQVGGKNIAIPRAPLTIEQALKVAKDAFTSAAERDIHTGDHVEIWIITKEGVRIEKFDLRKD